MKVGVLSDTHDNLVNIRRAVAVFRERGVRALLHAGDFCSPFTLAEFKPLTDGGASMHAIFGNNDGDKLLLTERGRGICVFRDGAAIVEIDGRRIAMLHYPDLAADLFASGAFDLVVYGHDHMVRIEGAGKKLLNPGTCSGYVAEKATIAIVETSDMSVEIVVL